MGWWREDGRKDDRRRHDDDEECGHEQATEVCLDRSYHAAHEVEDNKAMRRETSGLGPSRVAPGQARRGGGRRSAPSPARQYPRESRGDETTQRLVQGR